MTKQDRKNILKIFYRTELREDEEIINNSDKQIAKELNLPYNTVASFLVDHSNKKLDEIKNKSRKENTKNFWLFQDKVLNLLTEEITENQQKQIINNIKQILK